VLPSRFTVILQLLLASCAEPCCCKSPNSFRDPIFFVRPCALTARLEKGEPLFRSCDQLMCRLGLGCGSYLAPEKCLRTQLHCVQRHWFNEYISYRPKKHFPYFWFFTQLPQLKVNSAFIFPYLAALQY
jgi:hypothetical protein